MKKYYLLVFLSGSFALCYGSLSVNFDLDMRYVYEPYSCEYLEQYFIEKLTIENNADLYDVAYIGLRPTEGAAVSIGHGTINIYSEDSRLLYSYGCLDEYLDPLQSINGASLVYYCDPLDLFSSGYDGRGDEDIWCVVPAGNVPLELVFVPEPATLFLLAPVGLLLRKKRTKAYI